jgi:DNA-binding transcriptional MocR family regulator
MKTGNKTFLYLQIAQNIEYQINEGVLKLGDRLPSTRVLQKEYGVSLSTVLQAYYQLESKSLIVSKPRSGYYVIFSTDRIPELPAKSSPRQQSVSGDVSVMITDFYQSISKAEVVNFSLGVPAAELLPVAKLKKAMHETIKKMPDGGTCYDTIQGNANLRRQIAQRTILWGGNLTEQDLVITAGCTSALSLSLMSITQSGDTIIVESPVFFGILQLANILGLRVIELPTDPLSGIDLDALKETLKNVEIKAIILIPNFNNPLGSIMPDENKKEVVRLIQHYQIPLIEDDIYGDIYFGKNRPSTCKAFDDSGLVMWCGSFSKTLAGGYRIGWVAPGKFLPNVMKMKLYISSSTATIPQEAMASFLINGRYDHHLRKLRATLHANSLKYLGTIKEYFPEDTRVSNPKGSFLLWIELNKKIDSQKLYENASTHKISFSPGRIFTLQDQYNHCMRLSYGQLWNEKTENALMKLGNLAKDSM